MRSLAEAVLGMVDQLRAGAPLYTGVVPLLTGGGRGGKDHNVAEADDDAASYVTSAFSYGSDLQVGDGGNDLAPFSFAHLIFDRQAQPLHSISQPYSYLPTPQYVALPLSLSG